MRSNQQNIPRIFHKEMEQKQNKQLRTSEYPIEYSDHEQQLIYEVISGIFQKLLHKSAVAHGQNIQWNIPLYAAVCYVFVPFLMEYSKNVLQARPAPLWFEKPFNRKKILRNFFHLALISFIVRFAIQTKHSFHEEPFLFMKTFQS